MTSQNNSHRSIRHASFFLIFLIGIAAAQSPNRSTDGFPNTNFKPSMSITIIVLIAAFVFMGFFSIYIRQCTRDNRLGGAAGAPAAGARSRRAARGLDPAVIGSFPTFVYSAVKGLKIGKEALECAVCLNEFEDDETLRLLPKCDHVFHPECIDAWLASHVTCPVCRANLAPKSGEEVAGAEATATETSPGSDNESETENRSSEVNQNQVSITVQDSDQIGQVQSQPEVSNTAGQSTGFPSRPFRSKSTSTGPRFPAKFPRSHTTGHSILQTGEDRERFTLRLPDDIRKQILDGQLNRTTSCVTFTTRQGSVSGGSTRRGYRTGGEGSSRGRSYLFGMFDRTTRPDGTGGNVFSRTRSFFRRTPSVTLGKRVDGTGSGSVKSPFDCIGSKVDGDETPSNNTRPPV